LSVSSIFFVVLLELLLSVADKLIGKCVLGSYMFARGRALIQWNTAINNPMEQNQQWHVLCE
jgi:hypothetical protein